MTKKQNIDDEVDALEKMLNAAADSGGLAIDPEGLAEEIDMDEIDSEAESGAVELVSNLSKAYFDDKFMEDNPGLRKRIDTWIESMRILIKLRKSSERTHDILVKAIPSQPTNASLYRSQAQIESNLLSIQKQMDESVASITNLLKNYQLEINFGKEGEDADVGNNEQNDIRNDTHRGSKTFIQQMKERNCQVDLFTGDSGVDDFTGEQEEKQYT